MDGLCRVVLHEEQRVGGGGNLGAEPPRRRQRHIDGLRQLEEEVRPGPLEAVDALSRVPHHEDLQPMAPAATSWREEKAPTPGD